MSPESLRERHVPLEADPLAGLEELGLLDLHGPVDVEHEPGLEEVA